MTRTTSAYVKFTREDFVQFCIILLCVIVNEKHRLLTSGAGGGRDELPQAAIRSGWQKWGDNDKVGVITKWGDNGASGISRLFGGSKIAVPSNADNPHYAAAARQCWKNFH